MGFLDEILTENKKIYEFVSQNIKNIEPNLENICNIFKEYTDHSPKHSKAVLELGYLLNTEELNIYEKAIFTLAAYFHDIGMNVSDENIKKYKGKLSDEISYDFLVNEFSRRNQIDLKKIDDEEIRHYIALDHFRIIHGELSEEYIKAEFKKSDSKSHIDNNYIWNCVGVICRGHNLTYHEILNNNDDYSVEYYLTDSTKINVLYLTVLLRMSDICHFSYDRALPFEFINKNFSSQYSEQIWRYYSDLVTVIPDKEQFTIKIQADCDSFTNHREIFKQSNFIQEELFNSHKLLNAKKSIYKLQWKFIDNTLVRNISPEEYIFEESKYRVDSNKIINLLMGDKLYSEKLYSLRECIQNSLDAIKVCKKKIPSNHYIFFDINEKEGLVDIYDSGTGMDIEIFKNNFLSLGTRSFWKSWKGIQQWDIEQDRISLIAEHGIGNISYFMIANKIEIYSKYHFSQNPIHVVIEDYNDYVEFKPTQLNSFPKFTSNNSFCTPWDLGHGTCIRFHLKEKLKFIDIAQFLSENILRVDEAIILNCIELHNLPQVWFIKNSYDSKSLPTDLKPYNYRDDTNFDDRYRELPESYAIKDMFTENNYYHGDPKDDSLENNYINNVNYKARVNINYGENKLISSRISQNGILIRNASDFLYKYKDDLIFEQYGIDINVFGEYCFQLDAERTTIIDSGYNRKIIKNILSDCYMKYVELLSCIESSIYFPCGGNYYHGIEEILLDENKSICFHEQFVRHFSGDFLYDNSNISQSLKKSKLYLVGKDRNRSISSEEISSLDEPTLLIIKSKRKMKKKFVTKVISEINDNTIYYPDIKTPFLLPIIMQYKLRKVKDFPEFILLGLSKANNPDNFDILLDIEKYIDQELVHNE